MTKGEWLPLLNFSSKHGVSLSTLRRRIKSNAIQFRLEGGKYFILDEETHREKIVTPPKTATPTLSSQPLTSREIHSPSEQSFSSSSFVEASVLSSANRLVEEIKAAYAKILQEKEEQIAQLKEEVVDLRMLCRILEENQNKKSSVEKTEGLSNSSNEDFLFGDYQNREI